jgi:hypothetical protein
MEHHYIWLFDKSDRRGLWWAFLSSLLLHVLMFAIMATTTVFFPLSGNTTKLDIVWLYPSFLFGGETESPPSSQSQLPEEKAPVTSPAETASQKPAVQEREPIKEPAETRNEERTPSPSPPPPQQEEIKPAPPLSSEPEAEPETEPEMSIPVKAPALPPAEAKAETHETVAAKEPPPPAEKLQPAKKEIVAKNGPPADKSEKPKEEKPATAPETKHPPLVVPPVPPRPAAPQNEKPHAPVQTAATSITPPQAPPAAPRKEMTVPPAAPQTSPLPGVNSGERKAIVEKRSEPPPRSKPASVEKPAEKAPTQAAGPKGIFAPPLAGDLKLEITGPEEALKAVKIAVIFREYPKARHSRPMTKTAARNFQVVTPKMTRVAKNTLQAVIEIAGEGVYDFKNQSDTAGASEATFSVKLYENSGRAKTKSAGTRKIGDKGSIVKILMPEGILWSDESAFSGSMEDSESITKFNTDTGLVWKEYND